MTRRSKGKQKQIPPLRCGMTKLKRARQRQNAAVLRSAQNDKRRLRPRHRQKRRQKQRQRRGLGEGLHPTHRIVRDGWGTRAGVVAWRKTIGTAWNAPVLPGSG